MSARRYEKRHGSGNSSWKQHAKSVSKVDVGTHLSEQEVITDAFSKNETNTQEKPNEGKIGSHKICIREDLAKENMVFSQRI